MEPELLPLRERREAFKVVLVASLIKGIVYGFPMTFGVFIQYYTTHGVFRGYFLPLVGITSIAASYIGAPLVAVCLRQYPSRLKSSIVSGWMICILSLIASSFGTQLWHLLLLQGCCYGCGYIMIYVPLVELINQRFTSRRGLVYGILSMSSVLFSIGLPFLAKELLEKYGHSTTLRVYGIAIFILIGPLLPFVHFQAPQESAENETISNFQVFKTLDFLTISLSNIFQGLVFFLPSFYIPLYALLNGLSATQGALLLSLVGVSQALGQLIIGLLSDECELFILMISSPILSGIVTLCIWRLAHSLSVMIVFCLAYGFVAGGYSVLYARFATRLTDRPMMQLWLFGVFEFQRGVGTIVGGIVAGAMGGLTEQVINLVGGSLFVSGLCGAVGYILKEYRLWRQRNRPENNPVNVAIDMMINEMSQDGSLTTRRG